MTHDDDTDLMDRVREDDPESDAPEPSVSDSFDADDSLIEAELGELDEIIVEDADLDDEVELDTQFDETIEDSREMMLLQDLGIDLDDDDTGSALDYDPGLANDEGVDDEAAA